MFKDAPCDLVLLVDEVRAHGRRRAREWEVEGRQCCFLLEITQSAEPHASARLSGKI